MSKLDEAAMFSHAESAIEKAGSDSVRQTLVEMSLGVAAPGVTAALVRAAVRSGSTQLGRAAADLLIDIKDYDIARAIISECLESDDPAIQVRAVEAMETLEGPETFDMLQKALISGNDHVRLAAVTSLGLIVASKYHPLKSHMLESLADRNSELFQMFTKTAGIGLKREFAQVLGFADSDAVLPLLEEFSNDSDSQTRREAVLALAANGGSEAMQITERKLDDEDEMVVIFALDSLASRVGRDSEYMLRCIARVLKHPNDAVRRGAVFMLNWFPPSSVEELLTETVKDPDFEVQSSAQSLLRSMKSELSPIGLEATGAGKWGEDTLRIWEAGNVGMESERSESKSAVDAGVVAMDEIVAELERQAASGDIAKRCHAITELIELEDIADSPVLRKALYEDNESVRSRAARGLDFTRDAGLATRVLLDHPDSLVRRRAVDVLSENPSVKTRGERGGGGDMTFASERTQGMELFSYFLRALDDPDEGVMQSACYGIGQYLQFQRPIPVKETVRKLRSLEDDSYLSSLTRDSAAELIYDINEAKLGEPLVNTIDAAITGLDEPGQYASRLSWNPENETFSLDSLGEDRENLAAKLTDQLELEAAAAESIADASAADAPVDRNLAEIYAGAACSVARLIIDAVFRGAEALGRLGEGGWDENINNWQAALANFPLAIMDADPAFQKRKNEIERSLSRARLHIIAARALTAGSLKRGDLAEFIESEDDWVRMTALTALKGMWEGQDIQELMRMLQEHADDPQYDEAAGRAAVALLGGGEDRSLLERVAQVLDRCSFELRLDLAGGLINSAQEEKVLHSIQTYIAERSCKPLSCVLLNMAAVSGGGDGVDIEDGAGSDDIQYLYACKGLKAMRNDGESAEELKAVLREGEPAEREFAGGLLGLARVESATAVFASVSDQVDASWRLRTLCAGMMIRKGHRQGMGWFNKNAGHGNAAAGGRIALSLARAVADTLPIMLGCKNVNMGRFV